MCSEIEKNNTGYILDTLRNGEKAYGHILGALQKKKKYKGFILAAIQNEKKVLLVIHLTSSEELFWRYTSFLSKCVLLSSTSYFDMATDFGICF